MYVCTCTCSYNVYTCTYMYNGLNSLFLQCSLICMYVHVHVMYAIYIHTLYIIIFMHIHVHTENEMDIFERRGASTNGMPTSEQGLHSLRMKQLSSSRQEGETNRKKIFVRPTLPWQQQQKGDAAASNETKELFSDGDGGVESGDGEDVGSEGEGSEEGREGEEVTSCTPVLPSVGSKRVNPFKVHVRSVLCTCIFNVVMACISCCDMLLCSCTCTYMYMYVFLSFFFVLFFLFFFFCAVVFYNYTCTYSVFMYNIKSIIRRRESIELYVPQKHRWESNV